MYRPRLLATEEMNPAVYHCVSRVVSQGKVLGEREMEMFTRYMRMYEKLLGVRVLTHCLLSDGFHLLVAVPRAPEALPTNEELIAWVRGSLGEKPAEDLAMRLLMWEVQGDWQAMAAERARWVGRMWNLAAFMKVLKQRFSQWYNGSRPERRTGTLWENRYRSELVESREALWEAAISIDLIPVRDGMVHDAKNYQWSGFGEAMANQAEAQSGLRLLAQLADVDGLAVEAKEAIPITTILAMYRQLLRFEGKHVGDAATSKKPRPQKRRALGVPRSPGVPLDRSAAFG